MRIFALTLLAIGAVFVHRPAEAADPFLRRTATVRAVEQVGPADERVAEVVVLVMTASKAGTRRSSVLWTRPAAMVRQRAETAGCSPPSSATG